MSAQTASSIHELLAIKHIPVAPRPPYSPEFNLCDFSPSWDWRITSRDIILENSKHSNGCNRRSEGYFGIRVPALWNSMDPWATVFWTVCGFSRKLFWRWYWTVILFQQKIEKQSRNLIYTLCMYIYYNIFFSTPHSFFNSFLLIKCLIILTALSKFITLLCLCKFSDWN